VILHNKIEWRDTKLCRFGLWKWFWLHIFARLSWLVKNMATMCTCRKECNRYDLTIVKCFWLAHHKDSSRWFAIISPPPICYPNFSFMGGVAKKCITKLGCEKCFCRVTYWTPSEMLLLMDYKSIVNFYQFFIWQLIMLYIVNLCEKII
jgi:hypothetical protein